MKAIKEFSDLKKKKRVWHEAELHCKENPKRWMSDRRKFPDEISTMKEKLSTTITVWVKTHSACTFWTIIACKSEGR